MFTTASFVLQSRGKWSIGRVYIRSIGTFANTVVVLGAKWNTLKDAYISIFLFRFQLRLIQIFLSRSTFHFQFDSQALTFSSIKTLKLVLGNTTFKRLHSLTISNQLSNSLFFQYRNKTMYNPSTISPTNYPQTSKPGNCPPTPTWSKETTNWPARRNLINGSGAIKIERATPPFNEKLAPSPLPRQV